MRTTRLFLFTLLSFLFTATAVAQEVIVNVTPVQQLLPPQALLYVSDPGKYFNITLTNTSSQVQNVYLTLSVQQVTPSTTVSVVTPSTYPPKTPFVVPANGTKTLTPTEMKTMFNHIPANQIKTTRGLFDDYRNGSFGLLPEGDYEAQITAYRWTNPKLQTPVVVSSPTGGKTFFTICYKAQAPQFLMPVKAGALSSSDEVADLEVLNPIFTWTPPVITCAGSANQYRYSFKVVEVLKNQSPTEAMAKNPVVYKAENITVAQCVIPINILKSQFYVDRTYAAQVTAQSASTNVLNYVMIENEGKSTYRLFKLKTSDMEEEKEETAEEEKKTEEKEEEKKDGEEKKEEKKDGEKKEEEKDPFLWISEDMAEGINEDSLYTFSYPTIEYPIFPSTGGARKMFTGNGLKVGWISSSHMGGEGKDPQKIEIEYDVELFTLDTYDLEKALASDPIYHKRTSALEDSIPWVDIQDHVEKGNYMVLRVNPIVTKGESVAFGGEKKHIKDFALAELLSKKYFQCSNMIDSLNTELTKKKAEDFKGKTIPIGEYQLTIDEIKKGAKEGTFEGKGHVLWQPFGFDIGVCVKFTDLQINIKDIVCGGTAVSYSDDTESSDIDVVEKLFSDWGIDSLIADTGIPYASELSSVAKGKVKDIAKSIDLSKYYGYVKKGNAIVNALRTGKVDDLYMPLSIPKEINKSPVDIQIASMKFAATHATMDIVAEFTLPNSKYTKNDILVFGAPRICISPERLLPESGTIALLSDFTILDPKSTYEMTFKAPKNVIEPTNGCFVSWHDDKFEMLGLDLDMKIPGLLKDKNGEATEEMPVFNAQTTISDWDDWMAEITIDPFQAEALPGWTFTASNIIYDHSLYRNSSNMGKFPTDYDKDKAGIKQIVTDSEGQGVAVSGDNSWQGLYIKEIGIKFPKALEFGTSGDKRLSVSGKNMFFDKSGATLEITAANLLSAKTGKAGGWAFSLDKVYLSFIQSDFTKCGFSGKFDVPLLEGEIGYDCRIQRLSSDPSKAGQYGYIFKTQQLDSLSLDFILAKADFNKDQTYFILESVPTSSGKQDVTCELMLGGDITIGGADYLKKKLKLDIEIPGVHFCGMRLSNKKSDWESRFEAEMQGQAKNADLKGKVLYEGKDMKWGDACYFNPGKWSLASQQKKIGPFEFTLNNWDFTKEGDDLKLSLQGKIGLVSGINLSAECGVDIIATGKIPTSLSNISDIDLSYKETNFSDITVDATFADMGLKGRLSISDTEDKKGYEGSLSFTMPGNLFQVDATGGYFQAISDTDKYSYGWFYIKLGSKSGINIPPVQINSISGGFYYNCKQDGESAIPEKGLIGVIAGLKLSTTAGEDALNADVEMTVVYDNKNNRLSSFIFTGTVKAVNELVSAKANLVYENNSSSRYLQLDITVDATADTKEITNSMTKMNTSLGDLKKKLNSAYKEVQNLAPKGTLQDLNDESSTPDESKGDKEGEDLCAEAGAEINLQFKITWKENGKSFAKPKWHLYLGEPELSKRCKFTFLKFKSDIVSVDIGANAYICVGNELPNNGKLPAIPEKVANFLNGSSDGKGIESASLSEADRARATSLREFESQIDKIGGGVMFGAQVYGYLDVDLGIFYLNAGATAGFDISIIKLPPTAYCTNFSGDLGYKGWYGSGQLYAYLYAKFGIRINLGFWKKDFDVCDAGIGGLFAMQGPRPSNFEGKARVKLKLFDGLINIDRKFSFSCGQSCDLFYGNALDQFKLFGDLSIGYSDKDQGWSDKNQIAPDFVQRPYFTTEAPLEEPFRVLDETEKERLAKNYSGNKDDLDMEASRTFIFRSNVGSYVTLNEYKSKNDKHPIVRKFYIKGKNRYANYLDITKLNPNRYYSMTVTGYAKEIQNGKEVDPVKYNEQSKRYYNEAWNQSKTYYFCTGDRKEVEDCPTDLREHVAIAYPSHYNQIKECGTQTVTAYVGDIQRPNIAFYSDVSNKMFQKGNLKWRLYVRNTPAESTTSSNNSTATAGSFSTGKTFTGSSPVSNTLTSTSLTRTTSLSSTGTTRTTSLSSVGTASNTLSNGSGMTLSNSLGGTIMSQSLAVNKELKLVSEQAAKWFVTSSTCNLTTADAISGVEPDNSYVLRLEYETSSYNSELKKVETHTENIVDLNVYAVKGDWREGYSGQLLDYERPFVGSKITNIVYTAKELNSSVTPNKNNDDYTIAFGNSYYSNAVNRKFNDPYMYIAYLSNYALFGGWEFDTDRLDVNITTAQSCIYTDKGGVYEGKLTAGGQSYNMIKDWAKIRDLSTYTPAQYEAITKYPLPEIENGPYNYTLAGLSRVPEYCPSKKNPRRVSGYISDMYNPIEACSNICNSIKNVLKWFDVNVNVKMEGESWSKDMNAVEDWYANHRGQYFTGAWKNATIQVPAYQFPIVWGSCLNNAGALKKVTAWGTLKGLSAADKNNPRSRGHSDNSLKIFFSLLGKENMARTDGVFNKNGALALSWDNIPKHIEQMKKCINRMNFMCYRVNGYDFNSCTYTCVTGMNGIITSDPFTINYPLQYWNNYDK